MAKAHALRVVPDREPHDPFLQQTTLTVRRYRGSDFARVLQALSAEHVTGQIRIDVDLSQGTIGFFSVTRCTI